jgi:hypothetical protein
MNTIGSNITASLSKGDASLIEGHFLLALQKRWAEARFEPSACRAALERMLAESRVDERQFIPSAIERGGYFVTEELLFSAGPPSQDWAFSVANDDQELSLELSEADVPVVASLLRDAARSTDGRRLREAWEPIMGAEPMEVLCAPRPRRVDSPCWQPVDEPGIYRREHACLVLRSRTTTLVLDPQAWSRSWTTGFGLYPAEASDLAADCVLVSTKTTGTFRPFCAGSRVIGRPWSCRRCHA